MHRRKSIVIVDDNPGHLNIFKNAASEIAPGFEFRYIHLSETGPNQIWAMPSRPLFVLCNANLEGTDPLTIYFEIIKNNAKPSDFIPVIFYGHDDGKGIVARSLYANVSGFFTTPKNEADAAALLNRAIDYWSGNLLPEQGVR